MYGQGQGQVSLIVTTKNSRGKQRLQSTKQKKTKMNRADAANGEFCSETGRVSNFTLFNWVKWLPADMSPANITQEDWMDYLPLYDTDLSYMVVQLELCPTTDRLHMQGYAEVKPGSSWGRMKIASWLWPDDTYEQANQKCWVRRVQRNHGAHRYCQKQDTHVTGFRYEAGSVRVATSTRKRDRKIDQDELIDKINQCTTLYQLVRLPDVKNCLAWAEKVWATRVVTITHKPMLRPWAQEIYRHFRNQDDRQILVVVDPIGAAGKTEFMKQFYNMHPSDTFMMTGGTCKDQMYAYSGQKYVIIDLPRATAPEAVSYNFVELLKNGVGSSAKYMSSTKVFDPANVLIFTNIELNYTNWSQDRHENSKYYLSEGNGINNPVMPCIGGGDYYAMKSCEDMLAEFEDIVEDEITEDSLDNLVDEIIGEPLTRTKNTMQMAEEADTEEYYQTLFTIGDIESSNEKCFVFNFSMHFDEYIFLAITRITNTKAPVSVFDSMS